MNIQTLWNLISNLVFILCYSLFIFLFYFCTFQKGQCYVELNKKEDAIKVLTKALEIDGSVETHMHILELLNEIKNKGKEEKNETKQKPNTIASKIQEAISHAVDEGIQNSAGDPLLDQQIGKWNYKKQRIKN
jgi:hypothetical protein